MILRLYIIILFLFTTSNFQAQAHTVLAKDKLISAIRDFPYKSLYQPLYKINLPDIKRTIDRSSLERAIAIEKKIGGKHLKSKRVNILDIGSSLSYFSFYFADRGANVTALESDENNIKLVDAIREYNAIYIDQKHGIFDKSYVENMDYKYDYAFLLSVLHHINGQYGLEYTQNLLKDILDKVPVLFVELAIKEEDVPFDWKKALPNDPKTFFAKCENCKIELLGYFGTHLSHVKRPLYMVTKGSLKVKGVEYKIDKVIYNSYNKASNSPKMHGTHRFYYSGKYFIKEKIYDSGINPDLIVNPLQISGQHELKSIEFYNRLGVQHKFIPNLVNYELDKKRCLTVYDKITGVVNGADLHFYKYSNKKKRKIVLNLLNILADLETRKLLHGDIRIWNTLVDKEANVYLVDFDDFNNIEDKRMVMLWYIYHLAYKGFPNHVTLDAPPSTTLSDYGVFCSTLVKELLTVPRSWSFNEMRDILKNKI